MYTLGLIFLTLPLYFSHIFMYFGIVIGGVASFERQKMLFFTAMLAVATLEMLFTRRREIEQHLKKYGCLLIGLLLWPLVSLFLYQIPIDISVLRGSYEKFHGYLLYADILWLGWLLTLTTLGEKKHFLTLNLLVASLISVFALCEFFGFSLFLPERAGAWGDGVRSISTLGNPNYLAGYLLISFPWIYSIKNPYKWLAGLILVGGIISTRSYIGIFLLVLFLMIMLGLWVIKKMKWKGGKQWIFWGGSLLIVMGIIFIGLSGLGQEKLLSLEGRFVLQYSIFQELFSYPLLWITGYGPESVLRFFEDSRSALVSLYFPNSSIIDSSHNILLDTLFQYGIVPIIFLASFLYKKRKTWDTGARDAWWLGILFFMMNPYVVVPLSLLTLTALTHDKK